MGTDAEVKQGREESLAIPVGEEIEQLVSESAAVDLELDQFLPRVVSKQVGIFLIQGEFC